MKMSKSVKICYYPARTHGARSHTNVIQLTIAFIDVQAPRIYLESMVKWFIYLL